MDFVRLNIALITRQIIFLVFITLTLSGFGQDRTDVSLYLKKHGEQLDSISSTKGNLFHKLGHHGPAVENPWLAFRFYFDKRTSIDIYSKAAPGLELKEHLWYPDRKEQMNGAGADYYKVGKTVGLGGVRLWDGEKLIPLHPVSRRTARVFHCSDSSYMELYSEGIEYLNQKVNILMRLTVFPDRREARVDAFSLSGQKVQFATGINYFDDFEIKHKEGFIATWGLHPEDVAATPSRVSAAILFSGKQFEKQANDGKQILLLSTPATKISYWISSASSREKELNSFESFISYLENIEVIE